MTKEQERTELHRAIWQFEYINNVYAQACGSGGLLLKFAGIPGGTRQSELREEVDKTVANI